MINNASKSTRVARPSVSVLVVNFNSGEWLERCVASVLSSDISIEVLVGDNGSSDASIRRLREAFGGTTDLSIAEFGKNLGFSTAVNRLIRAARGEYVLLLNPDCIIQPDTVRRVLDAMRTHPACGMAGCLIRNPDGTEQKGCRRNIPNLRTSAFRVLPKNLSRYLAGGAPEDNRGFDLTGTPLPATPATVPAISGAFMLVTRHALETVGLMDENYFLHCEDLDWCLRFTQAGYDILFVPSVEILHKQGACSNTRPIRVEWHKHCGMLRFFRKFQRGRKFSPVNFLVPIAVALRFIFLSVGILLHRTTEPMRRAAKRKRP